MKTSNIVVTVLIILLIIIFVQYIRFKNCLDSAYTNTFDKCTGYTPLNFVDSQGVSHNAVKISKFPFSATVIVGSIKNI